MPRKYNPKNNKKRKYPMKRRRKYQKSSTGYRNYLKLDTGLLPQGRTVNMRYNLTQALTSSSGIQNMKTFRMNSIFDPEESGSTLGQPLGHDQYSLYYSTYQVIGAKVTTTFRWANLAGEAAAQQIPVLCLSHPDDDNSEIDYSLITKQERYPGLVKYLMPDPTKTVTIVNKFSAKKFFSIKNILDDESTSSGFGSNPAKVAYVNQGIQSTNSGSCGTVLMDTTIDYIVRLTQPKEISAS